MSASKTRGLCQFFCVADSQRRTECPIRAVLGNFLRPNRMRLHGTFCSSFLHPCGWMSSPTASPTAQEGMRMFEHTLSLARTRQKHGRLRERAQCDGVHLSYHPSPGIVCGPGNVSPCEDRPLPVPRRCPPWKPDLLGPDGRHSRGHGRTSYMVRARLRRPLGSQY